jgi:hypothetical protein
VVEHDRIFDIKAGKKLTYKYTCDDYNSNLKIGEKKYVMKEIVAKDKKILVYVLEKPYTSHN